ncbi:hypothetical protein LR48_Vigan03g058400 [Vigna angularis]|uniref:Uncharacterized protein n=1 Tax=Phaseolus angularis TaxID=3914 RepID=A0A0L9U2Z5_PHAAN|nr:hypothetical protein LR48_Vigan03g058400 [Vigna angularis]
MVIQHTPRKLFHLNLSEWCNCLSSYMKLKPSELLHPIEMHKNIFGIDNHKEIVNAEIIEEITNYAWLGATTISIYIRVIQTYRAQTRNMVSKSKSNNIKWTTIKISRSNKNKKRKEGMKVEDGRPWGITISVVEVQRPVEQRRTTNNHGSRCSLLRHDALADELAMLKQVNEFAAKGLSPPRKNGFAGASSMSPNARMTRIASLENMLGANSGRRTWRYGK